MDLQEGQDLTPEFKSVHAIMDIEPELMAHNQKCLLVYFLTN
jgi:hypothetical protein